ncbi:putative LRR receptor-like serine/threonine-protein kinase [Acorus calamus]|uniref:non-specific serine/threonine protein kinase n=1 Tax=Acorus calamus TaxID=4465 RepID=A0AAV9ENQ3_ACOCL|nr:putative LRR receptor-like serine/threonine-protein kinase [Acorus calamus]
MFTGSVPPSIGDLLYLEKLGLSDNRLGSGLGFLSPLLNLNYLHTIEMDDNPFNGLLPKGPILGNFSTSLVIFSASNCSIRGRFSMALFSNMSNLITLHMSDNELTSSVPTELKNLKGLQMLFLGGNRLEGSIPEEWFQSMINLGTLDLSQNLLSGSISNYMGNLTGLQKILLAGNAFSSTIPPSIWGLEGLISLNFSHNFLEGYLPKEVSNLKVLETMDLSSNLLSGFLPSTLGDLQMLANLNLSNNSFSGPIPQSFAHSINLNLLDLSSNSLSGEIPKSLADLRYLSFLNLSFNALEGEAPNGGVFANLTMQSLMGNTALCGAIKLGLPTCKTSDPRTSSKTRKSGVSNSDTWDPSLLHQRFVSQLELMRATNNFDEANLLGVRSFGSVYKGQLEDGTITAVKVLKFGSSERASKRFEAECEVMCNVRHRNLVKIISCCSSENIKALVLQYMPNKSLDKWLHSSEEHSLGILERVSIMIDVASALEYLHHGCSRPVVHSDVKPSNILLDEDMVAHLGDFGIAKLLVGDYKSPTPTGMLGTIGYVAPEYGASGEASIKGDSYRLLETFTGRKPTDEMFSNGSSIREWVKEAFPDTILQVIDTNLLRNGDIERARPTDDDIKLRDHKCFSSIMELGLCCSKESPKERMNMKDVVVRLNKIKMELMAPSVESNRIYNHSVSEA